MIKKILVVVGVVAFSAFWWVGFKKIMEMERVPPRHGAQDPSFLGGK